eukprot:scaffold198540_cov29-Tisochrysis_lutea.AAC.8
MDIIERVKRPRTYRQASPSTPLPGIASVEAGPIRGARQLRPTWRRKVLSWWHPRRHPREDSRICPKIGRNRSDARSLACAP